MATRPRNSPHKKVVDPNEPVKILLGFPQDVIDILAGILPSKNIQDAIIHLARSYDTVMADQGMDSQPVDVSVPTGGGAADGPTREEVAAAMDNLVQPRGSLGEVQVRVHDKSLPRDDTGLVHMDYILASGVPIVGDLATNEEEYAEHFETRMLAIRETLSKLPEDAWAGANVPTLVDRTYRELIEGRRPTGIKT